MSIEGVFSIQRILDAFGLTQIGDAVQLSGGLSGNQAFAVPTADGFVVVKRIVDVERAGKAAAVADLSERIRRAGAPVPRYRRALAGTYLIQGVSVQDYIANRATRPSTSADHAAFGRALGCLDRALWQQPLDRRFDRLPTVFARGKDPAWVESHYLPACDGRFPRGYREEVVRAVEYVRQAAEQFHDDERVIVHVDANPENVMFDENGAVTLIDLTPEIRLPGYSLGAALYWWAYPIATGQLDLGMLQSIAFSYRAVADLPSCFWGAVADHMLTHSLMELAFPLGCLVDGPPAGTQPGEWMADLVERCERHARLRARMPEIQDALSDSGGRE